MNTIFINDRIQIPFSDLRFRYSRSGGPGGQNVNKVSTRVELIFDVRLSSLTRSKRNLADVACIEIGFSRMSSHRSRRNRAANGKINRMQSRSSFSSYKKLHGR